MMTQLTTWVVVLLAGLAAVLQLGLLTRATHRRKKAALLELTLLTLASVSLVWFVAGGSLTGCSRTILILERPLDQNAAEDARLIAEQLGDDRWSLCALLAVRDRSYAASRSGVDSSGNIAITQWYTCHSLNRQENRRVQAFISCTEESSVEDAIEHALNLLQQRSWSERILDFVLLRQLRIVVAHGEERLWRERMPIEVDQVVQQALSEGVVFEELLTVAEESQGTLELLSGQQLPGHRALSSLQSDLHFVLSHPSFQQHAGGAVARLKILGSLNNTATADVTLANQPVLADGTIVFQIPVAAFVSNQGTSEVLLEPDFAALRLDVVAEITGQGSQIEAIVRAFIPVTTLELWFVQGEGAVPRLDRFEWFRSKTANMAEVESFIHRELAKPATDLIRESLYDLPACVELLARSRPNVLVLSQLSDEEWKSTPQLASRLEEAVKSGMHLIVIDPPVLPEGPADQGLADQLKRLLPAFSVPAGQSAVGGGEILRQTIDRTPVLTFIFDDSILWTYNQAGDFGEAGQASPSIPNGLYVQFEAARGLLEEYRRRGLVKGDLRFETVPEHRSAQRISYQRHPEDRIAVHVGPKISVPASTHSPDPSLANQLVPSMMDLRLAAAFPEMIFSSVDFGSAGLRKTDVPAEIRNGLDMGPALMPNHAVILFTSQAAPQPAGRAIGHSGSGVPIIINNDETDPRECRDSAAGMLRDLLLNGIQVAVIGIGIGPVSPGATSVDEGVASYSRNWPVNETQYFSEFSVSPEEYLRSVASKRLLSTTRFQPFYSRIDLVSGNADVEATSTGRSLAALLLPLHSSPQDSCLSVPLQYGRIVDERIRVFSSSEANGVVSQTASELDVSVPFTDRWGAPIRQRRLLLNPSMSLFGVDQSVVAVTRREASPVSSGDPMIVSGRFGAGGVSVFSYDPFESPPGDFGWTGRDAMTFEDSSGNLQAANRMGFQRITDIAIFWGATQSAGVTSATVRSVRTTDARGSLELDLDVEARLIPQMIGSGVQVMRHDGVGASTEAELVRVMPDRRQVIAVIPAANLSSLFSEELKERRKQLDASDDSLTEGENQYWTFGSLKIDVAGSVTRIACWIPPHHDWSGLSALESIRTACRITGGGIVSSKPPVVESRRWGAMGLSLMLVLLSARWALQRIRERIAAKRMTSQELIAIRHMDGLGASEMIGRHLSRDSVLKKTPTDREPARLFSGRGDPQALTRQSIGGMALGENVQLKIIPRRAQRNQIVTIVVSVGAAMRLSAGRDPDEPKIALAASIAEILSSAAIMDGATVWLQIGGVGAWLEYGEFSGVHSEGEISSLIHRASEETPARSPLEELQIHEGSNVYWISDFCEETLFDDWFHWVDRCRLDAGRVTAVYCRSKVEELRTGFVLLHSDQATSIHSRIGLSSEELEERLQTRVQLFRDHCVVADVPFVEVSSETCTSADVIAELFIRAGEV